jgi:hypothetical protein
MGIQTTYGFTHQTRQKGFPTYLTTQNKYTGYASVAVGFGLGLVSGGNSTDGRLRLALPATVNDVFLGVSVLVHKQVYGKPDALSVLESTLETRYEIGEPITYMRKGTITVFSEQAVNPTLPVFLRAVANGGLTVGNFRVDVDTNRGIPLPRARWVETTTAAGLALLELDY